MAVDLWIDIIKIHMNEYLYDARVLDYIVDLEHKIGQ
jgi:hypothetical protein